MPNNYFGVAVHIVEPVTLATDYVLAALAVILAFRLYEPETKPRQVSRQLWAGSLGSLALAAFLGGSCHGFVQYMPGVLHQICWKGTLYSAGLSDLLMLGAVLFSTVSRSVRRWLIGAGVAKFLIYAVWMLSHDEFRYLVLDYLSTMLLVLLLQIRPGVVERAKSARNIQIAISVSIVAAAVQQSGVDLTPTLNHNTLYHIVEAIAICFFYRAGKYSHDIEG